MMARMNRRGARSVLRALVLAAVCAPTAALGADSSGKISEISDSRIKESSGLSISSAHDDLAYTINDAGNAPIVFAIKVSTGDVVGTTRVEGGDIKDTESIAIDGDGTMWLADLGDNDEERDDVALYAFPEPGPGDHTVTGKRYPVSYENGPVDVEAFLVHPKTGAKFLASKNKKDPGIVFALPKKLSETGPNVATDLGKPVPEDVSDGTFTIDGSQALLRTRKEVFLVDPDVLARRPGPCRFPRSSRARASRWSRGARRSSSAARARTPRSSGSRSAPMPPASRPPRRPRPTRSRRLHRRRSRVSSSPPGWWSSAGSSPSVRLAVVARWVSRRS